ncbi:MAG: bifunctional metallophosphatase/5'-nucleotidase [Myxococcota bacterium]
MVLFVLLGCAVRTTSPAAPSAPAEAPGACTLLAINDTYRIEPLADGTGGLARVRTLREELEARFGDVVLLHAGDFLYPSLMSRTYQGRQMTEILGALDGDPAALDPRMYVVFGNHEFDAGKWKDAPGLDETIAGSGFRWLGSNVTFATGPDGARVEDEKIVPADLVDCGGLRVGVYGVTTDRSHPAYVEAFEDPVAVGRRHATALRNAGADYVVALTHQSLDEDRAMVEALGADAPDLVIGGHEHDRQQLLVNGVPVRKADADARSAWRVTVRRAADGTIAREEALVALDASIPEDPAVKALVDARLVAHDQAFCTARGEPAGCLGAEVGRTKVPLVAGELDIRRFETNVGNWVADQARAAYPDADIALVNSGSLRLNRDLAPGPITRQDIEETFAYPMPLVRLEIDGATLRKVLARAVEAWTGNGHWLQVSGLAWVHDPVAGTASKPTLLPDGRPIADTDRLVVVVPAFLADPSTGQDGYTMLPAAASLTGPDLKQLVLDALAGDADGIAPVVEGRICNPARPGPCLAR